MYSLITGSNPAADAAGLGLDELVAAHVQANVLVVTEAIAVEEVEDADYGATSPTMWAS
jgi:hypothetical protein